MKHSTRIQMGAIHRSVTPLSVTRIHCHIHTTPTPKPSSPLQSRPRPSSPSLSLSLSWNNQNAHQSHYHCRFSSTTNNASARAAAASALVSRRRKNGELVRDFISHQLYAHSSGYFNATDCLWSSPAIDFASLRDKQHYQEHLTQLYQVKQKAWLTPVELFKPVYAQAILSWILRTRAKSSSSSSSTEGEGKYESISSLPPLRIIEIGGGSGTLADGILSTLQQLYPHIYDTCSYTIIDLSAPFVQQQNERLHHHGKHFQSIHGSALDLLPSSTDECFVLALEVLDNMPHDKVVQTDTDLLQCVVHRQNQSNDIGQHVTLTEARVGVNDGWIAEYIDVLNTAPARDTRQPSLGSYGGGLAGIDRWSSEWYQRMINASHRLFSTFLRAGTREHVMWLPTVSYQLLNVLHHRLPNHRALFADFNHLDGALPGDNGPLVSRRINGVAVDYSTYLVSQGTCDIFFPTDFELLHHAYAQIPQRLHLRTSSSSHQSSINASSSTQPSLSSSYESCMSRARVVSSTSFFNEFGNVSLCRTKSGYNPLLVDFVNTSFFLTH